MLEATTKVKTRRFDLLSWSFVLAAALFVVVSIPATFQMTSLVHASYLAAALVAVLELMAFGAKLGSRWVPSWAVTLDRITIGLLTLTTVGNFGAGWDYLWANQVQGFWGSVRGYQAGGLYPGAILSVLVLSALVPTGIYLFLSLFCKRQAELDVIYTPEAAAERVLEPVIIQLRTVGRLQEELRTLNSVLYPQLPDKTTGLSIGSGPSYPAQALLEENGDLREQLAQANARLESATEALDEKSKLLAQHYRIEPERTTTLPADARELAAEELTGHGGPIKELERQIEQMGNQAATLVAEDIDAQIMAAVPKQWTLDDVAKAAGRSVDELRKLVKRFNLNTPGKAWATLRSGSNGVPKGLSYTEFERLYAELMPEPKLMTVDEALADPQAFVAGMEESVAVVVASGDKDHCSFEGCGKALSPSEKGVVARSKTRQPLCKEHYQAAKGA